MVNKLSIQTRKKTSLKQRRIFSEQIRKQTVRDIEAGKCSVSECSRELLVHSSAVYKWINKYSRYLETNRVLIVEEKSEMYRSKQLQQRIEELEAALGRKQLEIELLNKVIDLANEEFKTDLKKNLSKSPSSGSRLIKGSGTDTK